MYILLLFLLSCYNFALDFTTRGGIHNPNLSVKFGGNGRVVASEIAMIKYFKKMETIEIMAKLERIEQISLLMAKEALTMNDAAEYTGLSKSYLYKLACRKQIPYYKSTGGKMIYFSKKDLCSWLLKHRVSTTEEAEQAAVAYCVNNPRNGRKGGLK